jgi:hypothetical protein
MLMPTSEVTQTTWLGIFNERKNHKTGSLDNKSMSLMRKMLNEVFNIEHVQLFKVSSNDSLFWRAFASVFHVKILTSHSLSLSLFSTLFQRLIVGYRFYFFDTARSSRHSMQVILL